MTWSCARRAGVANVVKPSLLCDRQPRSAVDPGLGLVNGVLYNDYDLAAEDMAVNASKKQCNQCNSSSVCGQGNLRGVHWPQGTGAHAGAGAHVFQECVASAHAAARLKC
eukprot:365396-Chlamydomonas_euryale.AAC.29